MSFSGNNSPKQGSFPRAIHISRLSPLTASPYLSFPSPSFLPSPSHPPLLCLSLPYLPLRLSPLRHLPSALFRLPSLPTVSPLLRFTPISSFTPSFNPHHFLYIPHTHTHVSPLSPVTHFARSGKRLIRLFSIHAQNFSGIRLSMIG